MVLGGWVANVLLYFVSWDPWQLSSLQASAMDETSRTPLFEADPIMVNITSYPATWFGPHCQIKAQELAGHYSPIPRLQGSQAFQGLQSAQIHAVLELLFKVVNTNAKYTEWWPQVVEQTFLKRPKGVLNHALGLPRLFESFCNILSVHVSSLYIV